MSFKYVDLFAGIGGFHATLSALGGQCVLASEIDAFSSRLYIENWMPEQKTARTKRFTSDVRELGNDPKAVPGSPVSKWSG